MCYARALDLGLKMGMSKQQLKRLRRKVPEEAGGPGFTAALLQGLSTQCVMRLALATLRLHAATQREKRQVVMEAGVCNDTRLGPKACERFMTFTCAKMFLSSLHESQQCTKCRSIPNTAAPYCFMACCLSISLCILPSVCIVLSSHGHAHV